MYTFKVQNSAGETLELTHNAAYGITNIDGLDPPDVVINTTHNVGYDGEEFNSAYIQPRQITVTMAINSPAEGNRIRLYRYFRQKEAVRVFYKNGTRDVYIDGYVQSMQIAFFAKKQTAQIVIKCPHPPFNGTAVEEQQMYAVQSLFEFPFSIEVGDPIPFSEIITGQDKTIINAGDIDTGVEITIDAVGAVDTPKIYNVDTGEYMIFDLEMETGDTITIDTRRGQKSAYLIRNGVKQNIVGRLRFGSTWFRLRPGENLFTSDADASPENMMIIFRVVDQYEGV